MKTELFAKQMNILGLIFDKDISQELLAAYLVVLGAYSDRNFQAAVEIYVREGKFFPKPSELIELMSDMPADYERIEMNRRLSHAPPTEKTPAERDAAKRRVDRYIAQLRKAIGIADSGMESQTPSTSRNVDQSTENC